MIWPRKRRPLTQALLWDHLDACAIPFRSPVSHWLQHGHLTPSVHDPDLDHCIPDTQTPLFPSLDTPMRIDITQVTDLDAPPGSFWGAVRGAGNFQLNYAHALAGLTKVFGAGAETSTPHTVCRTWQFGAAQVTCAVWPPDKQPSGPTARHKLFPETLHEARITVHPAWPSPKR